MDIKTIREETSNNKFSNGKLLQELGRVTNLEYFDADDYDDCLLITGDVEDGSRRYIPEVVLSEDESEILDNECQCGYHQPWGDLCPHCVALLLAHLAGAPQSAELDSSPSAMGNTAAAKTSQGFLNLLKRYGVRGNIQYLETEKSGSVRLEPYLEYYGSNCRLEFKIGIQQMYVLKSIDKFINAVKREEKISYGKKLAFIHHLNAFAPEYRPLVKFLITTLERPRVYDSYSYYSNDRERYLHLDVDSMDGFIKAMEGLAFHGEIQGYAEKSWQAEQGMPPWKFQVAEEAGGIRLQTGRICCYKGRKYYYLFDDGKIWKSDREPLEELEEFFIYMTHSHEHCCIIGEPEIPVFCQGLLPRLEQQFQVEKSGLDFAQYLPPKAEFKIYLDAPQRDLIVCRMFAHYGKQEYNVFASDYTRVAKTADRDVKTELMVRQAVGSYFNAYDQKNQQMALAEETDRIYELLTVGIEKFHELGEVYVSDKLKALKVIPAPKVAVGVRLSGGFLELNIESELPIDQLVDILSKYDRKKRYYRLKDGSFIHIDDHDGIRAMTEMKQGLQLTDSKMKTGTVTIPKYRAMYLDALFKEEQGLATEKDRGFKALIRNMKTMEDNDFEIPEQLKDILREYQKRGYLWLKTLCANGFGGILADDMGLGKTLQVIAFLLSESGDERNRRSLVVCPASLVYNWKNEFEQFAPELSVTMVVGTAGERKLRIEHSGEKDILITSYDLLKRDIDLYMGKEFFCQVLDEAQYIKNHSTQAAQAVKQVQSEFRVALTGTPVENSLNELWSIFDYLMPGFLYGYQKFRDELETPIVKNQQEEALQRLQKMIRPFVLRRLKKDVLKDLPDKLEKCTYSQISGEQEELYRAHVQRLQMMLEKQDEEAFKHSKIEVLAELTKLRQICCDPALLFENYKGESSKLELCMDLVKNAVDSGHKILLFSQFTSMLDRIQKRMAKEKISFYTLTGGTSKEKRMKLVEAFQSDDTSVFCISLKAGGTGLNLTAADMVIHYDPWWNVAVENQASDRAHRIGQKQVVTVYKLVTKGTIEEKIIGLQAQKRELAEQVLGGEGLKSGSFNREELLELLSMD